MGHDEPRVFGRLCKFQRGSSGCRVEIESVREWTAEYFRMT
jgi:hypothetical protein